MKTTLNLDDDIADFLKEQSRIQDKTLQQVVNETLRLGMAQTSKQTAATPFRVKPNNSGFVEGIDPLHLNRLLDELEAEEFLAKNVGESNPSSPDALSLQTAYGSLEPSSKPENSKEITTIAKQAKAEKTTRELNER